MLSFGKELTLYRSILTFNNLREEGFGKHYGQNRKCWKPAFSPLPTVFSTLSRREITILAIFDLCIANAFNMVTSKILLFRKELINSKNGVALQLDTNGIISLALFKLNNEVFSTSDHLLTVQLRMS